MWKKYIGEVSFKEQKKKSSWLTKNPWAGTCQGSQNRPFWESREICCLLKQRVLGTGGPCDWCGACSHAKKKKKKHLIFDFSIVFGHEAGEKLKWWLQTVLCSRRNNEYKEHNLKCQAKWLRLILFVITSAERTLTARSSVQGCEIHILSTFFCFDN